MAQALAKQLGISRTPVREALIRLERDGFVREAEGKKFKVAEISLKDIIEIHEIRELVELYTVEKVALSCTEEQYQTLNSLAARMKKAVADNDHIAFFELDMDFHAQIIRYSNNETLEALMLSLNEKVQRIRHLTVFVYQRLQTTLGEHDDILETIKNHDHETARKAMKHHLDQVKKGVVQLFNDGTINYFGGANLSL